MIFEIGISRMSRPPAALRFGISSLIPTLATTLSTAYISPPASGVTVGDAIEGTTFSTSSSWEDGTLSLSRTLPRAPDDALEQQRDVLHRGALVGVLVGLAVGDELGVADQERVEDAQAVLAQRRAGLGEVDDRVDDVGDLGLGGRRTDGKTGP